LDILLGHFFEIADLEVSENKEQASARIKINPDHEIFAGHFPEYPVVPGVCIMQMIREILEKTLNSELRMVKGDNIKFLNIMVPSPTKFYKVNLKIKTEDNRLFHVHSDISSEGKNYCGLKGTFAIN